MRSPHSPDWSVLAPVLVACAGACWGCISLFSVPLAALGLAPLQIATVRSGLAAICLGLILAVCDRSALRIRLRDVWMFVGSGVASIAFFNVCYFACISECGAGLAVVSTLVPFALYTTGLAHMETGRASIMAFVEPAVALVVGVVVFGETLTAANIAGIACIAAAVVMLGVRRE